MFTKNFLFYSVFILLCKFEIMNKFRISLHNCFIDSYYWFFGNLGTLVFNIKKII